MKKRFFVGLGLFAILAVAPVCSQEKSDPVAATVKFQKIKIPVDRNEALLAAFFKPLLSEGGTSRFDAQSQTFVFKDTAARIEFIKKLAAILDDSELRAKDFFAKPGAGKKGVTETVWINLLTFRIGCDVGEEFAYAARRIKQDLLLKTIAEIKILSEIVAFELSRGLKLSGSRKRVELAKKIIALFDQTDLDQIYRPLG